ncbi:Mce family protein, Mce5C [Mycobacteroides abscessus subsp. abscessus]|uniref:MlaD family protein n=1 Tax=Mycobacteroides abscessus TaxID=36809 RepID=UPI000929E353|nr:MlaD family protein [Mycobacteroides abscessus]SHT20783.1 Mce family protein, Mce5C [Mycobacteroides abscessus subsp. abscessus]SHW07814.1 Mce family protein, Mce5C [Mycobacteroides abscessus subsp. abscessus]SIG13568.1 Mce family protein, Mce5C [Mycobacteroides abscessus subsp. abscessus]SKD16905.1 Mce family protein, Mce5C [Mycobacteroides abscessus subsp. abscessus]SKL81048.1 Mce family protein, Mce5C [Mycobacteroides abscessus subsp. abscessus]
MANILRRKSIRSLDSYNKTWIGFIAIGLIAALIGGLVLVKLAGIGYRHYTAQFAQAAALHTGNIVTVAGIPVGEVTSMRLAGDHVEAGLRVRDDVRLGADTRVIMKITTILGSRYLELRPGSTGKLPGGVIDLAHTEVPYDLQDTLADVTTTFGETDTDQIAASIGTLGKQLEGLPPVIPQAMDDLHRLSSIVANRRTQIGALLSNIDTVSTTLRRQQAGVGTLIRQGQGLLGEFVARRTAFHALAQSTTKLVNFLSKVVVDDQASIEDLIRDLNHLLGLLAEHDDLVRGILQMAPVTARNVTNAFGYGNAWEANVTNGILVDSWMCAISGRAKQFGMLEYFKDCK